MADDYNSQYLDPRWQKKRLKILERDDWRCQICGNDEITLHVHHRLYIQNKSIWDYPDHLLITLCESCHESEKEMKDYLNCLNNVLKTRFFAGEIHSIYCGFGLMPMLEPPEFQASAIEWFLSQENCIRFMNDLYSRYLHKKAQQKKEMKISDGI